MPVPFYTLAVRAIHYGRYGGSGEDPRLYPLYLGYPTLVRGYDVYTFEAGECVPNAASQCPAFDRLLGSRLLVGDVNFRFPLLRPFGASRRMYGPLPVELALFADGGVAWKSGQRPSMFRGTRGGVSSTGVTFRSHVTRAGRNLDAQPYKRTCTSPDRPLAPYSLWSISPAGDAP